MKPRFVVTAGPTREMIDPVRFLSNLSTGRIGYEIAKAAQKKGAHVTLVSGPVALKSPKGIRRISVLSAREMKRAIQSLWAKTDVLVMAAAVCDYTPAHVSKSKIRRVKQKILSFKQTEDIVRFFGKHKKKRLVVGFALETQDFVENAIRKLFAKNLDLIVLNWYSKGNIPFGDHRTSMLIIGREGRPKHIHHAEKNRVARFIVGEIFRKLQAARVNEG